MYISIPRNRPISAPTRSAPFSKSILSGLLAAGEVLVIIGSSVVIYLLYLGWDEETYLAYVTASAISAVLTLVTFQFSGLYRFDSLVYPVQQISKSIPIWGVICLTLILVAFALKVSEQFSRVWAFSWFFSIPLLLGLVRTLFYLVVQKWARLGRLTRNIVIVGAGKQGEKLLDWLDRLRAPWDRILGVFDDRTARVGAVVRGYPVLGNIEDLIRFAREHRIDDVIVALPWNADERTPAIVNRLRELPVNVHLSSDLVGFCYPGQGYSFLAGIPVLAVAYKPLEGWRIVLKEIEDRVLAVFLVMLFMPLMVLIALAIKLDSRGPVLFRQQRYGYNNKVFAVLKFRTMYYNRSPEEGAPQAKREDPRITPVGSFLRRTSLDELPQLFNVLSGQMSIVGPRPHPVPLNEEYASRIGGYFARHRMKPGITGWAQVHGLRGETEIPKKMEARVEHDIYYIENWSLLLDLEILARTAFIGFVHKNAY